MKYLFFDTECANCLNGDGKICSIGYVLTDESFNVLAKKDILIDPEAPFILSSKRGDGIKLAYPTTKFRNSKRFTAHYNEIKNILESEDTLVFGFAINSDIQYLIYTCCRYQLPLFNFQFYDIQTLDKQMNDKKNPSSLDKLVEQYSVKAFSYHRSDDDALMSMEVLKAICALKGMTVEEIIKEYPQRDNSIEKIAKQRKEHIKKKRLEEERRKKKEILFSYKMQRDLSKYDKFFYDQKFLFNSSLLNSKIDEILKNEEIVYKAGGKIVKELKEATVYVYNKSKKNIPIGLIDIFKGKFVSYSTFLKHLTNG